ncbi:MAG: lamin tail domain-containing protein [Nitrospirae bacterium]|nr:lamin tail domain-containing protein [Nitrospirota bacterium]
MSILAHSTWRLLPVLVFSILPACEGAVTTSHLGTCPGNLLPGDLVITEIMANPFGPGLFPEWIEMFNASDTPIALTGMDLVSTDPDGSRRRTHTLSRGRIEPGGTWVVGNVADDRRPDHIHYGYGDDLSNLSNKSGTLTVGCGGVTLDEFTYSDMHDGFAQGFDGSFFPDNVANDARDRWCDGQTIFGPSGFGSPGLANEPCPGTGGRNDACGNEDRCIDDPGEETCAGVAGPRAMDRPRVGDLVITEIMADPRLAEDPKAEWFEIHVARTVDLNDLEIGPDPGTPKTILGGPNCLRVEAGANLVFARSPDPAVNGVLSKVDYLFDFGLPNSGGSLVIGIGGRTLDQAYYPSARSGASTALDPAKMTHTDNDNPANWCVSIGVFGAGDLGTPGFPNAPCGTGIGSVCIEGDASREIVSPKPDDLVISEVMADPNAVPDRNGEWFEVYVVRAVDLNGLELGTDPEDVLMTLGGSACLRAEAGRSLVFAHSKDPAVNGGLSSVDHLFNFSLPNSSGSLFLSLDGKLLDRISYGSATPGVASALDPAKLTLAENDSAGTWCPATTVFDTLSGSADLGTPGQPNAACAGSAEGACLDTGVSRPIISPAVGDLVITEIMADPNAVTDANGEWFEVQANRNVDLNGLEVGTEAGQAKVTLKSSDCLTASAGGRTLFARSSDPSINGGLPGAPYLFNFGLANSAGRLILGFGGSTLDQVTYSSAGAGTSASLDPSIITATGNDVAGNWCKGTVVYGTGDLGTPGQANPPCAAASSSTCLENGSMREILFPKTGDLVITEFMADPNAVADSNGEWFEVYAARAVHLNGLELGTEPGTPKTTLAGTDCLSIAAGSYLVIARSSDPAVNGGLPVVHHLFGFSIVNSNGRLVLGWAGAVIDQVSYVSSSTGKASSLKPTMLDAVSNDTAANWCSASASFGKGDLGTPGSPNGACP